MCHAIPHVWRCTQVMYNYGSPRVGNYPFALMYDIQVPHSFRVVFDGDVVTGVPPGCRLYKHVGYEVRRCGQRTRVGLHRPTYTRVCIVTRRKWTS